MEYFGVLCGWGFKFLCNGDVISNKNVSFCKQIDFSLPNGRFPERNVKLRNVMFRSCLLRKQRSDLKHSRPDIGKEFTAKGSSMHQNLCYGVGRATSRRNKSLECCWRRRVAIYQDELNLEKWKYVKVRSGG